jgi:predicted chitinase
MKKIIKATIYEEIVLKEETTAPIGTAIKIELIFNDIEEKEIITFVDFTSVSKGNGDWNKIQYKFTIKDIMDKLHKDPYDIDHLIAAVDINHDGEIAKGEECKLKIVKKSCFCHRDFTVDEMKKIVKALRKSENIHSSSLWNPLYSSGVSPSDKSYETTTNEFNRIMKKYHINTCLRKIHFLAQVYHETDRFRAMTEYTSRYTKKYDPYRGRGLVHLTWKKTYIKFQDYLQVTDIVDNPSVVATNIKYAFEAGGWFWESQSSWGNLNKYADNDDAYVTNLGINGGFNGFEKRIMYVKKLIKVMEAKSCKNLQLKEGKELGIYKYSTSSVGEHYFGKLEKNIKILRSYDD